MKRGGRGRVLAAGGKLGIVLLSLAVLLLSEAWARPVVIELFTSQGCSACPPADRLLGELADDDDLLPLSLHVDYWNRIGWKDPFSSPDHTARQKAYARTFDTGRLYTPQMVIDGAAETIGSSRRKVAAALEKAADSDAPDVPITIERRGENTLEIVVGAGQEKDGGMLHDIWLLPYDFERETDIVRGENEGLFTTDYNVVLGIVHLGEWRGGRMRGTLDVSTLPKADALAVIVQEQGRSRKSLGRIAGAASYPLKQAR